MVPRAEVAVLFGVELPQSSVVGEGGEYRGLHRPEPGDGARVARIHRFPAHRAAGQQRDGIPGALPATTRKRKGMTAFRTNRRMRFPAINFAISTRGGSTGIDHLGFQTDDPAELAAMKVRAESADLALLDEGETTCCYARSEKHWVTDPQGIAWEHFHTLADIPVFREANEAVAGACCTPAAGAPAVTAETARGAEMSPGGCCTSATRGKPVGIPVRSDASSSCC